MKRRSNILRALIRVAAAAILLLAMSRDAQAQWAAEQGWYDCVGLSGPGCNGLPGDIWTVQAVVHDLTVAQYYDELHQYPIPEPVMNVIANVMAAPEFADAAGAYVERAVPLAVETVIDTVVDVIIEVWSWWD